MRVSVAPANGSLGSVLHVGRIAKPRQWMHAHDHVEFALVKRGRISYQVSGTRYDLGPHFLLWIFPGQEHLHCRQSVDNELLVAHMDPVALRRAAGGRLDPRLLARNPAWPAARRLAAAHVQSIERLLLQVLGHLDDALLVDAALPYLFLSAWRAFTAAERAEAAPEIDPAIDEALLALQRRDAPRSLAALAARVGMGPSAFSRRFRSQVGSTPVEVRNRARIERFLAAWDGRPGGILRCALAAGFGSYPQFHRVFRQLMGCTPSQHRPAPTA